RPPTQDDLCIAPLTRPIPHLKARVNHTSFEGRIQSFSGPGNSAKKTTACRKTLAAPETRLSSASPISFYEPQANRLLVGCLNWRWLPAATKYQPSECLTYFHPQTPLPAYTAFIARIASRHWRGQCVRGRRRRPEAGRGRRAPAASTDTG